MEDGRRNPSIPQGIILALECPSLHKPSSSRRPSRPALPQSRIPQHPYTPFATQLLSPFIVTIHPGKDIGETIRASFEESKENIKSSCGGLSVEGRIYGVSGDILNPKIDLQGSATTFEGIYSMATLLGRYVLSTEGPVQLDYLKVNFQPKDKLIGGRVVGPLIAGSGVQVTLGYARSDMPAH